MDIIYPHNDGWLWYSNTDRLTWVNSDRNRQEVYYIYDGQLILNSVATRSNAVFDVCEAGVTSGCLVQNGTLKQQLTYKPEYKEVLFPLFSFCVVIFIFCFIYHLMIKRLLP